MAPQVLIIPVAWVRLLLLEVLYSQLILSTILVFFLLIPVCGLSRLPTVLGLLAPGVSLAVMEYVRRQGKLAFVTHLGLGLFSTFVEDRDLPGSIVTASKYEQVVEHAWDHLAKSLVK